MTSNWDVGVPSSDVHPAASFSAARRATIGQRFNDRVLVIPTGNPKVRANDTDYRFRAGTDFFYLTGCGEPDAVLVIAPGATGPRSTLYVAHRRDHHTHEFFTDARYGELWVGVRRGSKNRRRSTKSRLHRSSISRRTSDRSTPARSSRCVVLTTTSTHCSRKPTRTRSWRSP